jgi:hypothetical protein
LLKLLTAIKLYDALSISEQGKGHWCQEIRGRNSTSSTRMNSRLQDIHTYEVTVNLFSMEFIVNVETVPAEFQMETADLHCDTNWRNIFRHLRLCDL